MELGARAQDSSTNRNRALRLLHQERYRPEEAAYLLGIEANVLCQAAFHNQLNAEIVGHDVVSFHRDDLIRWLERDDDDRTDAV